MRPILGSFLLALALGVQAQNNVDSSGLALKGYDPVAYFADSRPVPGRPEFTARHEGATYRFASAASRDLFLAAPARYAPQCWSSDIPGYIRKADANWPSVRSK